MPNIKPSLFIGIGTTGAEILGHLQELIVQEYLTEEFPVTRLLSLITDESDARNLRHASREHVCHLTVPNTEVVRNEMMAASTRAGKALGEWLAPELCLNNNRFEHGSNSMRMAGKLHLWRNYSVVWEAIGDNIRACTAQTRRREAAEHLSSRLGVDLGSVDDVVERGLNIYVVGSLCGGTCSGMYLDLGYLLRCHPEVIGLGGSQAVQIFGVFTVVDSKQADNPKMDVFAANCHAALREFDFCHHRGAEAYPIAFPDGESRDRDVLPYDFTYLLSPSSINGLTLVGGDNKPSHSSLLQMIAQNLFLDSYAGTYSIKQGLRVGFRTRVQQGAPDLLKRRPRSLFSFGCAVIAYPMYSIARAAASRIARTACLSWLTSRGGDFQQVLNDAQQRLRNEILPLLTKRGDMTPLDDELRTEIRTTKDFLTLDAQALRTRLAEIPDAKNAITKRFGERGRYHDVLSNQCREVVEPLCRSLVRDFVTQCRVNMGRSLPDVQDGLSRLRDVLQQEERAYSRAAAQDALVMAKLDPLFGKLRALEKDFWLQILGLRRNALTERKAQLRLFFERLVLNALDNLCARFRAQAVKCALEELDAVEAGLRSERKILADLADPENDGAGYFSKQESETADRLRNPPCNVRHVFSVEDGSVETELERQGALMQPERSTVALIQSVAGEDRFTATWTDKLLESGKAEEIGGRMLDALTIEVLRHMQRTGINVLNDALRRWESVKDVVSYASPYIEFTPAYLQGSGHRLLADRPGVKHVVFGYASNNADLARRLQGQVPVLQHQDAEWGYNALSDLPHYVVFYQEEAYFSTTFLAATAGYERAYEKFRATNTGGGQSFIWTRKSWYPHGPETEQLDRAEYIGFLIEHAFDVLRGTRVSGDEAAGDITDRLFKWLVEDGRHVYFVERPVQSGSPDRVYVGTKSDYLAKAKRDTATRFIPHIVEKLTSVVRTLAPTPQEAIDKFKNRYMAIQRRLDLDRDEAIRTGRFEGQVKKDYEMKTDRLYAFFYHVGRLTWPDFPEPEYHERLRQFTWLINWAREKY